DCSLRGAIGLANNDAANSTISVPAGIYTLDTADFGALEIGADNNCDGVCAPHPLTITGAGSPWVIIDGNQNDRVFLVDSDATATIAKVTVANGRTSENGGGIQNRGHLTLDDDVVTLNATACCGSENGGGIANTP